MTFTAFPNGPARGDVALSYDPSAGVMSGSGALPAVPAALLKLELRKLRMTPTCISALLTTFASYTMPDHGALHIDDGGFVFSCKYSDVSALGASVTTTLATNGYLVLMGAGT